MYSCVFEVLHAQLIRVIARVSDVSCSLVFSCSGIQPLSCWSRWAFCCFALLISLTVFQSYPSFVFSSCWSRAHFLTPLSVLALSIFLG